MKKSIGISALCVTGLIGCSTANKIKNADQRRSLASDTLTHEEKEKILRELKPISGVEEYVSSEFTLAKKLMEIFGKIADENKSKESREIHRGTHAKGSCFNGEISIFSGQDLKTKFNYSDKVIKALKAGVFSFDETYPIEIRFANAKGGHFPDTNHDVRGVGFSMLTDSSIVNYAGSNRLDFMMNNSPMFAVNNITEFYELMKAARLREGDIYPLNPLYLGSTKRAAKLLKEYERNDVKSFATEIYWANLPYVHGKNSDGTVKNLVKYRVVPCDGLGTQRESSEGKSAHYLQADISERMAQGSICFHLEAQVFDRLKLNAVTGGKSENWKMLDWVEEGGKEWSENAAPFYKLATITVPKELNDSLDKAEACKIRSVNTRLFSNPENQPVGSLARVRTLVEEYSRAKRMGELKN